MMAKKKKKDSTFSLDSPADQRAAEDGARAEEAAKTLEEHTTKGNTRKAIAEGRQKSMEAVGTEADLTDLSEAIKSDGLTESEAGSRLLEKMQEAGEVEPDTFEKLPPEERERLAEAFEDSGSVEDAAAILEESLRAYEAGESEGEGVSDEDLIPFEALTDETGITPDRVKVRAKIDGEEVELSLSEAVEGYQRTADYTRKSQQVAEQRKEVQEDAERLAQQTEALGLALQQAGVGPDQLQAIEQFYNQAKSYTAQAQQEQIRQAAEQGAEAVREEFGWKDETDWSIARAQLATTAEKLGFEPEEYGNVTDPRYVKLLEYARRGMEGDSRKDPPPMKPGQGNRNPGRLSRKQREFGKARERLARTGSETAAAEVLEGILAQEGN